MDDLSSICLGADASASPATAEHSEAKAETYPVKDLWQLPKGTWFDEAFDLREPEGDALTKAALAIVDASEDRKRKRKRRVSDEGYRYVLVRKILANGLRCFHHREPSWVAYLRKADSYKGKDIWLSGKAMARSIDALEDAGLVKTFRGEFGTASTYDVTQALFHLAQDHGANSHSLTHKLPPESLVRLRRRPPERDNVAFEATDQTRHWTALLESYNAFLVGHNVGLALSREEEDQWVNRLNENGVGGMQLYRPELIQTDLYRQFNNGSFEEGGRMYGGWWINAPRHLRSRITIDGAPTVELDFSGCAIRMLYHDKGIDYRDDPYQLDAITRLEQRDGLGQGHFREAVKAMTQALINDGKEDGKPERIQLPANVTFRRILKRSEVREMIEAKHAAIADAFGTGAGLRLQRKDSDLALAIITDLKDRGMLALPVHDSFIIKAERKDELIDSMAMIYHDMFRYNPVIK